MIIESFNTPVLTLILDMKEAFYLLEAIKNTLGRGDHSKRDLFIEELKYELDTIVSPEVNPKRGK